MNLQLVAPSNSCSQGSETLELRKEGREDPGSLRPGGYGGLHVVGGFKHVVSPSRLKRPRSDSSTGYLGWLVR